MPRTYFGQRLTVRSAFNVMAELAKIELAEKNNPGKKMTPRKRKAYLEEARLLVSDGLKICLAAEERAIKKKVPKEKRDKLWYVVNQPELADRLRVLNQKLDNARRKVRKQ